LEIEDTPIEWDARNTRKCICFFLTTQKKGVWEEYK